MRGSINAQAGGPNGSRHRPRAQEMLTAEAIIKKRRNRRERSHTAHGRLVVLFRGHDEHEKVHAPNDAVLDGFVELGRFLWQRASPE